MLRLIPALILFAASAVAQDEATPKQTDFATAFKKEIEGLRNKAAAYVSEHQAFAKKRLEEETKAKLKEYQEKIEAARKEAMKADNLDAAIAYREQAASLTESKASDPPAKSKPTSRTQYFGTYSGTWPTTSTAFQIELTEQNATVRNGKVYLLGGDEQYEFVNLGNLRFVVLRWTRRLRPNPMNDTPNHMGYAVLKPDPKLAGIHVEAKPEPLRKRQLPSKDIKWFTVFSLSNSAAQQKVIIPKTAKSVYLSVSSEGFGIDPGNDGRVRVNYGLATCRAYTYTAGGVRHGVGLTCDGQEFNTRERATCESKCIDITRLTMPGENLIDFRLSQRGAKTVKIGVIGPDPVKAKE